MSWGYFYLNTRWFLLTAVEISTRSEIGGRRVTERINLEISLSLTVFYLIQFDFTFTEGGKKRLRSDTIKSCFGHLPNHLCLTYLVVAVGRGSPSCLSQNHMVDLNG